MLHIHPIIMKDYANTKQTMLRKRANSERLFALAKQSDTTTVVERGGTRCSSRVFIQ
jgi:hypothetical protein